MAICTLIKTHSVEIETCDTGCTFPFVYEHNLYYKCVVNGQIPTPFCVTNRKVFEHTSNIYFPNGTKAGWKTCNETCSVERKCPVCEPNYVYDGKNYSNCIYVDNQSGEKEVATLPWCITNSSSYKVNPETGWMYCSNECVNNVFELDIHTLVYVIITASLVIVICVLIIFFKRRINAMTQKLNEAIKREEN